MRRIEKESFFNGQAWFEFRYSILKKYGRKCMNCQIRAEDGAIMQVDHIIPISVAPHLRLVESNVQVLCKPCNLGKSDRHVDDFRPKAKVTQISYFDDQHLSDLLQTLKDEIDRVEREGNTADFNRYMNLYLKAQAKLHAGEGSRALITEIVVNMVSTEFGPPKGGA